MSVKENLIKLLEQIRETSEKFGRNPDEIKLVAVTKYADIPQIREAYEAGQRDFGENYVQQALPKIAALPDDINWHFIGHIQKNKINKIIGTFVLVHSVDSARIAEEIDKRCARKNIVQDILIEVHTSGEETKFGVPPEEAEEVAHFIAEKCPNLALRGLMTMAPFTDDRRLIEKSFSTLLKLREKLQSQGLEQVTELSMGMTNDWQIAIEYGATILRIGSAIFRA